MLLPREQPRPVTSGTNGRLMSLVFFVLCRSDRVGSSFMYFGVFILFLLFAVFFCTRPCTCVMICHLELICFHGSSLPSCYTDRLHAHHKPTIFFFLTFSAVDIVAGNRIVRGSVLSAVVVGIMIFRAPRLHHSRPASKHCSPLQLIFQAACSIPYPAFHEYGG